MQKSTKMTVLPIRTITMTSPTVTSVNNKETKTSRISNFSVASLLADTKRSSSPSSTTANAVIRTGITSENPLHHHLLNNNFDHADIKLVPKNLSINHKNSSRSPNSPHSHNQIHNNNNNNNNDSSNNSIKLNDSELLESSQRSHTPHSSIASEEYDDSMRDDEVDEEDSDVDIEENSTNGEKRGNHASSLVSGQPPIRPTPFSALAAAAAAWSMNNGAMQGWPGRQMPPFGAPGMFPGQGFPQINGGV